jgi:hypothetical protein
MAYIRLRSVAPGTLTNRGDKSRVGHAWVEISPTPGILADRGMLESYDFPRRPVQRLVDLQPIARQLAAERAGAEAQGRSDGRQAHTLQPHRRQRHALFSLHLLESSGHLHTLPDEQGVALQI